MDDVEYIIYCRKSTEENANKQTQSIPDQIRYCMDFAEKEGLKLKARPKNFTIFETPSETAKMENCEILADREQYRRAKPYFVVKEEKSGKIPFRRKKRRAIIKMVEEGKIKGILSYSPDRQTRNLFEAGELVDLIDRKDIDLTLKYTNFHFEPNASGKMMLGIRFVLSKQYSDKLSEDVRRGKESTVKDRGKADGNTKHGYIIDENGYYKPHPKFFGLIREAFEMKIYQNKSNREIKEFLDTHGYVREYKTSRESSLISENALSSMRDDTFYYGYLVIGEARNDLRESQPDFKTMINEDEYAMLVEQKCKTRCSLAPSDIKDEYDKYVMPFERGFIISEGGASMTFNLPNRKRFSDKLEKLKISKPEANLSDVISMNQIRYKDANKHSTTNGLEITADIIDTAITQSLKDFKVNNEAFEEYQKALQDHIDVVSTQRKEKRSTLQLQYNSIESQKIRYIAENSRMLTLGEDEARVYNEKKKYYDECLSTLRQEISELDDEGRNVALEMEAFVGLMNNASNRYAKGSFVQKREISKIVFSNIFVDKKKKLHLAVKPIFQSILVGNGGGYRTRTYDPLLVRQML